MNDLEFGFHAGPSGNHGGLGEYYKRLDEAGRKFCLKSVDHYGHADEALNMPNPHNVEHTVVFRLSSRGQSDDYDYDVPAYNLEPEQAAHIHMERINDRLPSEFDSRCWIEPINEVDQERSEWLGQFAVECAKIVLEGASMGDPIRVERLLMFAWSSGEPEAYRWPHMKEYLKLCAAYPSKFGIALHEYSYVRDNVWRDYPFMVGRFQALYDYCDKEGIARPFVVMTEWGWTLNDVPSPAQAMKDIAEVGKLYKGIPAAIWCLQGGDEWGSQIQQDTQKMIEPLTALSLAWVGEDSTAEPPLEEPMKHKAIVTKYAQEHTASQANAAWNYAYPKRRTITASDDDTLTVLAGGRWDSYVELIHPELPSQIATAEKVRAAGYSIVDITETIFPTEAATLLGVPHVSQLGTNAMLKNDCGSATGCMLIHYFTENRPSPDQFSNTVGKYDGANISVNQLMRGLAHYGVLNSFKRPTSIDHLEGSIDDGKPVILLFQYKYLPQEVKQVPFDGWHFWVLDGYDEDSFYCLDPLSREPSHSIVDKDVMMRAMVGNGANLPYQCIVGEGKKPKPKPPTSNRVDLLPFFLATNGRKYMMRNASTGAQEKYTYKVEKRGDEGTVTIQKGRTLERYHWDSKYIYQDVDTSNLNDHSYTVRRNKGSGILAPWFPRFMSEGESWSDSLPHWVQVYYHGGDGTLCEMLVDKGTGSATNSAIFLKHESSYTTNQGGNLDLTVGEVVTLKLGTETHVFARDEKYGRLSWGAEWGQTSATNEDVQSQSSEEVRRVCTV